MEQASLQPSNRSLWLGLGGHSWQGRMPRALKAGYWLSCLLSSPCLEILSGTSLVAQLFLPQLQAVLAEPGLV
jgi:hypothetical protein